MISTAWIQKAKTQAGPRVVGGTDTVDFDPELAMRMRKLRVGQNLRLVEDDGRTTAARIAWISANISSSPSQEPSSIP